MTFSNVAAKYQLYKTLLESTGLESMQEERTGSDLNSIVLFP
jgi:hypothetical protein